MHVNQNLLEQIYNDINWEAVSNDSSFSEDNYGMIENNLNSDLFYIATGASKIVLVPKAKEEEFVIKIPFCSIFCDDWERHEEDEDYYGEYIELQNAPLDNDWDYCAAEVDYYNLAIEHHIEMFFPNTSVAKESPYPIYIQERCLEAYDTKANTPRTKAEISEEMDTLRAGAGPVAHNDWLYNFKASWILDAIDAYGEATLAKLFQFLDDYNINDLHASNYGYSVIDHRPVLIDFSGFHD